MNRISPSGNSPAARRISVGQGARLSVIAGPAKGDRKRSLIVLNSERQSTLMRGRKMKLSSMQVHETKMQDLAAQQAADQFISRVEGKEEVKEAVTVSYRLAYEHLVRREELRKSFFSLPFTFAFWLIFILVSWAHANVPENYHLGSSVSSMLRDVPIITPTDDSEGRVLRSSGSSGGSASGGRRNPGGELPPSVDEVKTATGALEFVRYGLVPAIWNRKTGYQTVWIRTYNKLIGGMRIYQKRLANVPCPDENMRSFYGRKCHGDEDGEPFGSRSAYGYSADDENRYSFWIEPHVTVTEAEALVDYYLNNEWIDDSTQSLSVEIPLYNSEIRAFSLTTIECRFTLSGSAIVKRKTKTVVSEAYQTKTQLVFDSIWMGLLVLCASLEVPRMASAIRKRRFREHVLSFATLVELATIIFGFGLGIFWFAMAPLTGKLKDQIAALPTDNIPTWNPTTRPLPIHLNTLDSMMEHLTYVIEIREIHRVIMFWYTIIILLRFSVAFEGQPRLAVIQRSIRRAWVDMSHFLIIFLLIFFNFALGGYILFGNHLVDWNTTAAAITSSFRAIMGDFNYADMHEVAPISAALWFWCYMILTFLILLNMFLAIILDTYSEIKRGSEPFTASLWDQGLELYLDWRMGVERESVGRPGFFWEELKRAFSPPGLLAKVPEMKDDAFEAGSASIGQTDLVNKRTHERLMMRWEEEQVDADLLRQKFGLRLDRAQDLIDEIYFAQREQIQALLDPQKVLEEKLHAVCKFVQGEIDALYKRMEDLQTDTRLEVQMSQKRTHYELNSNFETLRQLQSQAMQQGGRRRSNINQMPANPNTMMHSVDGNLTGEANVPKFRMAQNLKGLL